MFCLTGRVFASAPIRVRQILPPRKRRFWVQESLKLIMALKFNPKRVLVASPSRRGATRQERRGLCHPYPRLSRRRTSLSSVRSAARRDFRSLSKREARSRGRSLTPVFKTSLMVTPLESVRRRLSKPEAGGGPSTPRGRLSRRFRRLSPSGRNRRDGA